LFESADGLPAGDLRTIVPNGRSKLIIPFQGNPLIAVKNRVTVYRESTVTVTGMMNGPVVVETSTSPIGILGVEFKTASAHRLLSLPLQDLTDAMYDIGDVLGKPGRVLQWGIAEADVPEKIRLVEEFLLRRLSDTTPDDPVTLRAVQAIVASAGRVRITDLCRELGYSRRYLDLKFADHVGLSPKALARIVRFQHVYRQWGRGAAPEEFRRAIYDCYYDQAHFIKEFKQFTGYSPVSFTRKLNEFGRIFYRA
jgi:AraC-like DNA-binding protein